MIIGKTTGLLNRILVIPAEELNHVHKATLLIEQVGTISVQRDRMVD